MLFSIPPPFPFIHGHSATSCRLLSAQWQSTGRGQSHLPAREEHLPSLLEADLTPQLPKKIQLPGSSPKAEPIPSLPNSCFLLRSGGLGSVLFLVLPLAVPWSCLSTGSGIWCFPALWIPKSNLIPRQQLCPSFACSKSLPGVQVKLSVFGLSRGCSLEDKGHQELKCTEASSQLFL